MPVTFTRMLRWAVAPAVTSVTGAHLGFPAAELPARAALDRIPQAVVVGFESALESPGTAAIAARVELMDEHLRGFGYEGAVMATTILDAATGGSRTRALVEGPARPHGLLAYIGVGFALARLPRRLWSRALPELDLGAYHPTLSWLAVDGYGFDLAYFDRHRWVGTRARPRPWPFQGAPTYFARAVDQGMGRAVWFIDGARPEHVAATVGSFDPARRGDVWSGVGLAATFAGPSTGEDVAALAVLAGEHAPDVRLGAVLAARARCDAGSVPAHTEAATHALAGLSPAQASEVFDACAVLDDDGPTPAYERWRLAIKQELVRIRSTV
ncbi:DUF1702 family protein [Isoptericola sp. 178]|uniref:DUF1702 family protein n=1 Tax=Isoptericola sp. 178 TaxID=3064651 RepID=UPI00271291DD|nr:DUF1702 family protein [Isoptericola sp. 178]MDO8145911.1 DUF1702 family protein [Isoptericola sp. 178]